MVSFRQNGLMLLICTSVLAMPSLAAPQWTDYPRSNVAIDTTYNLTWKDTQGYGEVFLMSYDGDEYVQLYFTYGTSFRWLVAWNELYGKHQYFYLQLRDKFATDNTTRFAIFEKASLTASPGPVLSLPNLSTATQANTLSTTSSTVPAISSPSTSSTQVSSSTNCTQTPPPSTAPTATQSQPVPTDTTTNTPITTQIKSSMPTGTKAAIFLGTILGIVFIILGLWLWRRNSTSKGKKNSIESGEPISETEEVGLEACGGIERHELGDGEGREGMGTEAELSAGEVAAELPATKFQGEISNGPVELG
ncbi:hypothetical protein B0J14DRAFT_704461 [Halenospora varia]|nr:hypothetical protein B0J14DRAFT_704461 [Halenospora varia]